MCGARLLRVIGKCFNGERWRRKFQLVFGGGNGCGLVCWRIIIYCSMRSTVFYSRFYSRSSVGIDSPEVLNKI